MSEHKTFNLQLGLSPDEVENKTSYELKTETELQRTQLRETYDVPSKSNVREFHQITSADRMFENLNMFPEENGKQTRNIDKKVTPW